MYYAYMDNVYSRILMFFSNEDIIHLYRIKILRTAITGGYCENLKTKMKQKTSLQSTATLTEKTKVELVETLMVNS